MSAPGFGVAGSAREIQAIRPEAPGFGFGGGGFGGLLGASAFGGLLGVGGGGGGLEGSGGNRPRNQGGTRRSPMSMDRLRGFVLGSFLMRWTSEVSGRLLRSSRIPSWILLHPDIPQSFYQAASL